MELQRLIGEFNLKRMSINNEASKKERDQEKLSKLNTEMREAYSQIMSNENMIAYNDAKAAFDVVANRVLALFSSLPREQIPKLLITASHHAQAAVLHAAVAADKRF